MFQGQQGWFCRSVSQELRQIWGRALGEGGGWVVQMRGGAFFAS